MVEQEASIDFLKNVIFLSPGLYIIMKIAICITHNNFFHTSDGFLWFIAQERDESICDSFAVEYGYFTK